MKVIKSIDPAKLATISAVTFLIIGLLFGIVKFFAFGFVSEKAQSSVGTVMKFMKSEEMEQSFGAMIVDVAKTLTKDSEKKIENINHRDN